MKKTSWLFVIVLILLLCPLAMGESALDAVGTRPALAPSGRLSPVVPYADVFWGDSSEDVARAAGGEISEQDGKTVVTATVEIDGIPRDVQVIYSFDESGLCQVEAIASSHMSTKLTDLSTSKVAKTLQEHTKDFFSKWLKRYFWHGKGNELFMTEHTVAALQCRGEHNNYRLSVVYNPPAPFDIEHMEAMDGINVHETGEDIQYYLAKPLTININTPEGTYPIMIFEMVRVKYYTEKYMRVPYNFMTVMYDDTVDLGDVEYLMFTIDGTDYRFDHPLIENKDNRKMAAMVMGEKSLALWEALASTETEIKTEIKAGSRTLTFPLPEEVRQQLLSFYDVYREANGLSSIALGYASDSDDQLTISVHKEIEAIPAFTIDTSAVPFMELDWKEKMNNLSKTLGVKPEKSGTDQILRSTIDIDGVGEELPVEFLYRKNALEEISVVLPTGTDVSVLTNYITHFVGDAASFKYHDNDDCFYEITDRTEFAIGILPDQQNGEVSMHFFPAHHYQMDALKKDKSVAMYQGNDREFNFYDPSPKMFEHPYTYQGNRFTYSWFEWVIRFREYNRDVGRIPIFYFYLDYHGTKDPSSVKYITFETGGDFYRFTLDSKSIEKQAKTEYGEYSQIFTIWMDKNNYPFFQKISKGGKVTVNLLGDQFSLAFTMPNEARTKLAKGLKLLEKIGGLSNAALTFSLFNGTAMTTN